MYYAMNGERVKAGEIGRHELKDIIKNYVVIIRECNGVGSPKIGCIPDNSNIDNKRLYKTYSGSNYIYMNYFDDGQLILPDGGLILIENAFANLYVSLDINGFNKKPNKFGYDLFIFKIDKNGRLIPGGTQGFYESNNDTYCSESSSDTMNGAGCTYKALTEPDYFKKHSR